MQNDDQELLRGITGTDNNQPTVLTDNSVTTTPLTKPVTNAGPPPAAAKQSSDFWDHAVIEEAPSEPVPPVTNTTTDTGTNTAAPGAPAAETAAAAAMPKVTSSAIATSARTAVATINLAQITLLKPLLNWRFKKECEKRFGEYLPELQDMVMGEVSATDEAWRARKKKFEKFLKERDTKVKGLPFTDDEEKDMETAFRQYFQMKQVTMSPEVLLVCSLATTIGSRVIDVAVWD